MNTQKLVGSALALTALAVMGMGSAQANISPTPNTPTITPTVGGFTFSYTLSLDALQTITPAGTFPISGGLTAAFGNDFFTFYDVAGFTGVANGPSNFTVSSQLMGPPAQSSVGTANPFDDPSLSNVTFTYNGSVPLVGNSTIGNLGTFSFDSTLSQGNGLAAFVGRATTIAGNLKNANQTPYFGPSGPTTVPEPASVIPFALGGLGLLGLIARKTRRSSGAAA